ncbi:MAG: hypothetical protein QXR17_06955 [Candidatus Bathyarchaeia archaeon]
MLVHRAWVTLMEMLYITLSITSIIINILIAYFACRLMHIFKGGVMSKPLRFICLGVTFIAVGLSTLSLKYMLANGSIIPHAIGASLMLLGGVSTLIGVYLEYKNWKIPK